MGGVSRKLSNVGIASRFKQFVILMAAILLGVIISTAVDGTDFHNNIKCEVGKIVKG